MFSNDQKIDAANDLLREAKQYADLRLQRLKLDFVSKLTLLLSALVVDGHNRRIVRALGLRHHRCGRHRVGNAVLRLPTPAHRATADQLRRTPLPRKGHGG